MLRGAQKQMIVVRTRDSRVFEEAYFVIRHGKHGGLTEPLPDKEDMLTEANRIIERSIAAAGREGTERARVGSFFPGSRPEHVCRTLPTVGETEEAHGLSFGKRLMTSALWFLGGLLCGGGSVGLIWLLV